MHTAVQHDLDLAGTLAAVESAEQMKGDEERRMIAAVSEQKPQSRAQSPAGDEPKPKFGIHSEFFRSDLTRNVEVCNIGSSVILSIFDLHNFWIVGFGNNVLVASCRKSNRSHFTFRAEASCFCFGLVCRFLKSQISGASICGLCIGQRKRKIKRKSKAGSVFMLFDYLSIFWSKFFGTSFFIFTYSLICITTSRSYMKKLPVNSRRFAVPG